MFFYVMYREIPNDDAAQSYRAVLRGAMPIHRATARQQAQMLAAMRPRYCAACAVALEPSARGRPPRYCSAQACRRQAAADRQARKRRRDSGLPLTLEVQSRGGRADLLTRAVRRRAGDWFPSLTLTAEDLDAIRLVVRRIDPVKSWMLDDVDGWLHVNGHLLRNGAAVERLRDLIERQRASP